jgi:hypothetical protein
MIYDVIDSNNDRIWEKWKLEDYDITPSEVYENKVILGQIDNSRSADLENVIDEEGLPSGDVRCQEWIDQKSVGIFNHKGHPLERSTYIHHPSDVHLDERVHAKRRSMELLYQTTFRMQIPEPVGLIGGPPQCVCSNYHFHERCLLRKESLG